MIIEKSELEDKEFREFLIENCSVGYVVKYVLKLRRDNKSLVKKLNMLYVSQQHERTLGINSCSALIKSMPTEQAIQIMKSDITGQPQTTVIDGELVVAYVR